jgi:hypothetical protein
MASKACTEDLLPHQGPVIVMSVASVFQAKVFCPFGPLLFQRHRPSITKVFAPLFSKSGCFFLSSEVMQ